jgi:hypothetical protein
MIFYSIPKNYKIRNLLDYYDNNMETEKVSDSKIKKEAGNFNIKQKIATSEPYTNIRLAEYINL